jgi:hypothetical protein
MSTNTDFIKTHNNHRQRLKTAGFSFFAMARGRPFKELYSRAKFSFINRAKTTLSEKLLRIDKHFYDI